MCDVDGLCGCVFGKTCVCGLLVMYCLKKYGVCFVVLCLCVVCLNVFVGSFVAYCAILSGVLFVMCCVCCVVGVCVVCV